MAEKNSVITSLRTIRIVIDAIHKRAYGHDYRNRLLSVMRREMAVIVEKHRGFGGDHSLRDKTDLREQLADGLQALATLLHDGGGTDWDDYAGVQRGFETHREVNSRLMLIRDLASHLISKAEEALPPSDEEKYPQDETGLDAFVTVNKSDSPIAMTTQPITGSVDTWLWSNALDEIDETDEKPDDSGADDIAF